MTQALFAVRRPRGIDPTHRRAAGQHANRTGCPAQLLSIWLTKPEPARRVRQSVDTVLEWAEAAGYRTEDNPVEVSSMTFPPSGPSGEALGAIWSEFDEKQALWTIPAERMKATREHRVPLSSRSMDIVVEAKPLAADSKYVFPGRSVMKPMSNMILLTALRRMDHEITAHGFRSAFRDWDAETTNIPREVAEMALAHAVENKVEAAYRRGDLLSKRRELMAQWSSFVSPDGGKA